MSGGPDIDGVMECPDGHRCENGSLCVENPYDEGNYYCDCDASRLDGAYRGLYCEHEATEYCSYKGAVSRNSFCTNGGKCIAKVAENEAHLGCDCPGNYDGDHCQFVKGTNPSDWPGGTTNVLGSPQGVGRAGGGGGGGGGMSGGAVAGIVIGFAIVVVGSIMAVYLRRVRTSKRNNPPYEEDALAGDSPGTSPTNKVPVTDLQLDPDGGTLRASMGANGGPQHEDGMVEEEGEII